MKQGGKGMDALIKKFHERAERASLGEHVNNGTETREGWWLVGRIAASCLANLLG